MIVPKHTWPEKEEQGDPAEPGYYPTKPDWKQEHDEAARHDMYAGCDMKFIVTVNPDPYRDRTFTINYLGAWTKDMIVGADGKPLADSYTSPKNTATYVVDFSLPDVPADIEGQQGALEASYSGGTPLKVMAKGVYSGKFEELIGQDLENGSYEYKIRQVVEPWTISFGPGPASGVTGEMTVNGLAVWAYKNSLYIRSDSKDRAYIYSMSGSLYKYLNISEGDTKEVMNRGVYVVVIRNNRYKVIIK